MYRQVVGNLVGTNCAPLIADLFLYCYKSQFMAKLHKNPSKTDLIDKFNNTYRYLDDIFSVNNSDFYKYTSENYPKKLTLNKANNNSIKCQFLDVHVTISQGKITTKIYDKRNDCYSQLLIFQSLTGTCLWLLRTGYTFLSLFGIPVFEATFQTLMSNLCIIEKLLSQGFRYNKLI